ncbi:MAG TPA: TIGR03619 family F420-dependent LLM class oxidoreductase, partial [Xanthobacteraceae bacterium]|nr:TIGR03619 family F420-dependent LLM class oxidoreductase [Xanthobacteraceae bacterium]
EALGYDYVALSDHVVEPINIQARYPYSETGEFPRGARGERHEQLTALTWLAGKTTKLRFLTSVMVVPHRPAVLTAKILATIDVLSGGRLTVGIGAGWLEEEFVAIGAPPFADRGAATDEYLQAFRALWTQAEPRFDGRFVKFSNIIFAPKPVQKPHPPLWVGGESGPALRRAAKLCDGWYPIGSNPAHRLDTLARFKAAVERLRKLTREAGRDPASVALAYRVNRHGTQAPAKADNGDRYIFSGTAAEIVADLRAMRDLGVVAVDFSFPGPTVDAVAAALRQFHEEVAAHIG